MGSRVPCRIHRRALVRGVKKYKEVLEKCILWFTIVDSIFYHVFLFYKLAIFYYRLHSCNFAFKYYATNRLVFLIFFVLSIYWELDIIVCITVVSTIWMKQINFAVNFEIILTWNISWVYFHICCMLQFSDKF